MKMANPTNQRRWVKDWKFRMRNKIIDVLGGVCVRCGFSDRRALQVDHIHGGGAEELRSIGNNHSAYFAKIIERGSDRYQLLCANCNWIKRHENNECAAKKRVPQEPVMLELWRKN